MRHLDELRYEPTPKRVRAKLGDETVIDSTRAVLLLEPRRVVATYAVPADDISADVRDAGSVSALTDAHGVPLPEVSDRPVLDPSVPFAVHTADGEPVEVVVGNRTGAAFRLSDADPVIDGYVVLDFDDFDEWFDEDEPIVAHPKDPFHRIDVARSSRPVRVEADGEVIAESTRTRFLFETLLPVRYYFPREDVVADLSPSDTVTSCAYKGRASYWSPDVDSPSAPDLGWSYENPLHDALEVASHVAFFTERVDLFVDGEPVDRPITPWTKR